MIQFPSLTMGALGLLTTGILGGGSAARAQSTPEPPKIESTLQTVRVDQPLANPAPVYTKSGYFEAPNWTRDGATLLFDVDGRIMKVPASGGSPEALDIGAATRCNGSHGLSPDGKLLAITCNMPERPGARV